METYWKGQRLRGTPAAVVQAVVCRSFATMKRAGWIHCDCGSGGAGTTAAGTRARDSGVGQSTLHPSTSWKRARGGVQPAGLRAHFMLAGLLTRRQAQGLSSLDTAGERWTSQQGREAPAGPQPLSSPSRNGARDGLGKLTPGPPATHGMCVETRV